MSAEIRPAMGWKQVLVLANNEVELLITLDVGPRIISYRHQGGLNVFKTFDDQLGTSGEADWQIRGGHRLWMAPETTLSYFPDNQPVSFTLMDENHVCLRTPAEAESGIEKEIEIILDKKTSSVTLNHSIWATKDMSSGIAPWGLTVLKAGGKAIIPMPPRNLHPNDLPATERNAGRDLDLNLLPNRKMSLWAYTNLTDTLGPFGKSRRGNSLRSWPGRSTRTPRPAAGGSSVGRVIVKVSPPRGDLFGRTSLSHSSLFSRQGWFFSWPRCAVASARTSGAHHAPSCCGCACSGSGEYGDRVARAPVGGVGQSGTSSTSPASRIMPSSLLSSVCAQLS